MKRRNGVLVLELTAADAQSVLRALAKANDATMREGSDTDVQQNTWIATRLLRVVEASREPE